MTLHTLLHTLCCITLCCLSTAAHLLLPIRVIPQSPCCCQILLLPNPAAAKSCCCQTALLLPNRPAAAQPPCCCPSRCCPTALCTVIVAMVGTGTSMGTVQFPGWNGWKPKVTACNIGCRCAGSCINSFSTGCISTAVAMAE